MSVLPILPRGFVVGRILTSRGDSADADKFPDTAVVVGAVDFTPATPYRKLDAATVVTHNKITAKLDSHGDLHPQREASDNTGSDAEDGIWLPVGTWAVTYRLNTGFGGLPGHSIEVTEAHTEAEPLPLFANLGDPAPAGATFVQLTVPLGGQQGQVLVMNDGSLSWGDTSGILPETITDAVEDYLVTNPPASPPDATTTNKGLVELATIDETTDGVDTTRAVTPAGLDAVAVTKAQVNHNHDDRYYTKTQADDRYLAQSVIVTVPNIGWTDSTTLAVAGLTGPHVVAPVTAEGAQAWAAGQWWASSPADGQLTITGTIQPSADPVDVRVVWWG